MSMQSTILFQNDPDLKLESPDDSGSLQHLGGLDQKCLDQNGGLKSFPKLCEICGKSFEGKNRSVKWTYLQGERIGRVVRVKENN